MLVNLLFQLALYHDNEIWELTRLCYEKQIALASTVVAYRTLITLHSNQVHLIRWCALQCLFASRKKQEAVTPHMPSITNNESHNLT